MLDTGIINSILATDSQPFSLRVSRTRCPDFSCHISFSKKQRIKTCQFHTYEERLLFSLGPLFPN